MELTELNTADYTGGHYGTLRTRKAPFSEVNEGAVHFDWSSHPVEDDREDENSHQTTNLKELPLHMGLKKAIRQVQQMRVPVVSSWGSWRLRHSKSLQRFRDGLASVSSLLVLWRKSMHQIGGHFGGGVRSYFLFLRFLVILNFLSFLLMAGFVIIPSIVFHSSNSSGQSLVSSVNLSGVDVCLRYDVQLPPLTVYYTYFLDLLSGMGFMEYSYMFYGFYNNTEVSSSGFSYNIPLAYLLTAAFYFLFCLLCIVVRMGRVARVVMAMDGGRLGGYSVLVFTGWDHGLQEKRAVKVKHNNLRYRLQVDLEEERIKRKAESLTLSQAFLLYSLRILLNLIVLAMIVGAFFAISYATQYSQYRDGQRELHCVFVDLEKAYDRVPREELYCMRKSGVAEKYVRVVQDMYERSRTVVRCAVVQTEEFKVEVGLHQGSVLSPFLFAMVMDQLSEESEQKEGFVGLLLEYLPSMVITASNFVVPFLCDQIANLEKYSPSVTVILALLRAVFLRLVSLAVLFITLWQKITCEGNTSAENCSPCSYNYAQYQVNNNNTVSVSHIFLIFFHHTYTHTHTHTQCWETRVGQEMYKLTLFDFLITIAVMVLVEFPRRLVVDHCSCKLAQWVGRQEFVVASNVLALVYAQTVVWSGALFCPMLPLINTIKFVILFYCKKVTLFQNCRPAVRTFRSTSSNFFIFLVLLFGWVLSSAVLIYSIASIHPSYGCGPFRFSSSMWDVIPGSFHLLSNTTQEFLLYIGSQAFSIPLFILSCVVMCYVAALASVYGKTINMLKKQHKLEGRDKQFLVKQIKELNVKVSRNEQLRTSDAVPRWGENYNPAFEPDEEPEMPARDFRNGGFYDTLFIFLKKMNILPKKSWHVRNKDNIARVRRDEQRAAEEEDEVRRRAERAEQEARTEYLRRKSRAGLEHTAGPRDEVETSRETGASEHLNLFPLEDSSEKKGNTEYLREKKEEKEKQERAIGLLVSLGPAPGTDATPWYLKERERDKERQKERERQDKGKRKSISEEEREKKEKKLKDNLDPMKDIKKALAVKDRKEKKHKKKEKRDKGEKTSAASSREDLRAERLRREAEERRRAQALLDQRNGVGEAKDGQKEPEERERPVQQRFLS
ncbi:hypothetical protein QTP86_018721 [Hemibagrus guttatus]|nr:hypothetical protein QTP86_018721 [Hemibagrus guttatus]